MTKRMDSPQNPICLIRKGWKSKTGKRRFWQNLCDFPATLAVNFPLRQLTFYQKLGFVGRTFFLSGKCLLFRASLRVDKNVAFWLHWKTFFSFLLFPVSISRRGFFPLLRSYRTKRSHLPALENGMNRVLISKEVLLHNTCQLWKCSFSGLFSLFDFDGSWAVAASSAFKHRVWSWTFWRPTSRLLSRGGNQLKWGHLHRVRWNRKVAFSNVRSKWQ